MDVIGSGPQRPPRAAVPRALSAASRRLLGARVGGYRRPGGPETVRPDLASAPPGDPTDLIDTWAGERRDGGRGSEDRFDGGLGERRDGGRGSSEDRRDGGLGERRRRPSSPRRRAGTAAAVILVAAGALLALRAGAEPVPPREPAAAAPTDDAGTRWDHGFSLPVPPFDRLPGHTPIPPPTLLPHDSELVTGRLPVVGGRAGRPAAERSAELVIGRYCREPDRLVADVEPDPNWQRVTARVYSKRRSGDPLVMLFQLRWTGRAYVWLGSLPELASCG
ncbi:MAG TPA: hypothetical protein VEL73_04415 [Mycobacteriales bacterium]|nr:hypothetical protein [Mycobacteriales bacterium]